MSNISLRPETRQKIIRFMEQAGVVESDLVENFIKGSGAGGQKINKTSSCVQLIHNPSARVVKCQRTRSREVNRWLAREELAQQILEEKHGILSARQQEAERIRRQKRRRSRRQRERMLADKRKRSEKKALRRSPGREE